MVVRLEREMRAPDQYVAERTRHLVCHRVTKLADGVRERRLERRPSVVGADLAPDIAPATSIRTRKMRGERQIVRCTRGGGDCFIERRDIAAREREGSSSLTSLPASETGHHGVHDVARHHAICRELSAG